MQDEAEFLHTALHNYRNVQCTTVEEFNEDLNRITLIRKLLSRYKTTGDLAHRLILNYIIVLFNVFGLAALDLLLYKIKREQLPQLFPFLLFLNKLPDDVSELYKIDLDEKIVEELGKI